MLIIKNTKLIYKKHKYFVVYVISYLIKLVIDSLKFRNTRFIDLMNCD